MVIDLLVAVRPEHQARYRDRLGGNANIRPHVVTQTDEALARLASGQAVVDVLVLDNGLERAHDFITALRQTYPRLIIVLVDEEADFATPGQADEISTAPFDNDDLTRRIQRLMSDRGLETLRADAMPPVREFAKRLRKAVGELGKHDAAVGAGRSLGYEYVAYYTVETNAVTGEMQVRLSAQDGAAHFQAAAPQRATEEDIIGWVAKTGQSRVASQNDTLNHPFVRKGHLGGVVCIPVGRTNRYGVLVACREATTPVTQENVLLLELISAQLGAVLSKN